MKGSTLRNIISDSDETDDLTEDQKEEIYKVCFEYLVNQSTHLDEMEDIVEDIEEYKRDLIRVLIKHKSRELSDD